MPFSWGRLFIALGTGYISYESFKSLLSEADSASIKLAHKRGVACPGNGQIPCKLYPAGSIEKRAKMIGDLIKKGSLDPQVRRLAVRAVSKKCDGPNGEQWCTPSRDAKAEIERVFADYKNPSSELARGMKQVEGALAEMKSRYRYVSDARLSDQFQSAARTLFDFHGGDCDDAVVALGALLMSLGFPVKTRIYTLKGDSEPGHIALRVSPDKNGSKYVTIDASVDYVKLKGKKVPIFVGWDAATHSSLIGSYKDYPV